MKANEIGVPEGFTEEELDALALAVQNAKLGTPGAEWGLTEEYVKRQYRRVALAVVAQVAAKYEAEIERLTGLLNAPEVHDFVKGVALEAAHQRQRWGSEHDEGKAPADWFWLVGYLAGKALHAHVTGNALKALHHTISTAAALCNWHAAILGKTDMRPGIATPAGEGGGQ